MVYIEETVDSICRFYSGLNHEIQDIVDYKDFNTIDKLFQFAMLVEKELQDTCFGRIGAI